MPSSKPKAADAKSKKLVKSGPKYIDQQDLIYDFDLKKTKGGPAAWMILAFCAWNHVVLGATLGQYVSDYFLYYWFSMVLVAVNVAITVVFCRPLLWGQYVKMNMRKSMEKIALVAAVFGGALVVTWGLWILILTFQDWTVLGVWSTPFPIMTRWWQEGLYHTGLVLSLFLWAVVESLWWNVGFDGVAGSFMPVRVWGALCAGVGWGWFMMDPCFKGEWAWLWLLWSTLFIVGMNLASFFVTDFCGLGGAIGLRAGWHLAVYLLFCHLRWQWWGVTAFRNQFGWTPGNLLNLADQTPPSP